MMENIKDKLPMFIAVIVAIVFLGIAIYFMEFSESVYYTQIDNSKMTSISATDNMKYEYNLNCYNEKGSKKEIKFKTSRELRERAFLKLEVRSLGVHSWEEVSFDELPSRVKEKYNI